MSGWHWASSIRVLAAYAAQGDFEQAVECQEKATEMVAGRRRDEFRARLDLYKVHKPLREEPRYVGRIRRNKENPESIVD